MLGDIYTSTVTTNKKNLFARAKPPSEGSVFSLDEPHGRL